MGWRDFGKGAVILLSAESLTKALVRSSSDINLLT
jgi:hypothetical protein